MPTREENLKKINDELEKLSDDELDMVTGGSLGEVLAQGIQNMILELGDNFIGALRELFTNPKYASKIEQMIKEHPEMAEGIKKLQYEFNKNKNK